MCKELEKLTHPEMAQQQCGSTFWGSVYPHINIIQFSYICLIPEHP